ncbi:MAG: CNNM domain-containing protein [Planctomycetaceae bacterium]|nr:CNNM domain-containing protein [Planctomycetaceae bacterium]
MLYLLSHYPVTLFIMLLLMIASVFFSMSESAFFSLGHADRKKLSEGNAFSQAAYSLLQNSEQLLTSILLGNLIVNFLYFTLSTVLVLQLQQAEQYALAGTCGVGTLFILIVFCEILPKNTAVLASQPIAVFCAFPLRFLVNLLQPLLVFFNVVNRLSTRLLFPNIQKEPYLRIDDLEQAIELSKEEATLLRQEEKVLQNIVQLSKMRVEELMCPRSHLHFFTPPTTFAQVMEEFQDELPRTGYILISEKENEELASAVSLRKIGQTNTTPIGNAVWDENSAPVVYVPWTLSVADALDILKSQDKEVAAVLNEYGATIGVLTREDIFDSIFGHQSSRSRRLLNRLPITKVAPDVWHVTGLTNLRRLEQTFQVKLPSLSNVTIAGFLQEHLERLPNPGDELLFGNLNFRVLNVSETDGMMVEITRRN